MVASEKQIQKSNLEEQLLVLTSEIDEKTIELSSILIHIDSHKESLAEFELDKLTFSKEKESFYKDKEIRQKDFSEVEKNHLETIDGLQLKEVFLKDEIKDSTRKLSRLNNSCLIAKSDLDEIQSQIKESDKKLRKLAVLVEHYEEMQEKVRLLNIERLRIINIITEASNKSTIELKEANSELQRMINETNEIATKRDLAAYDYKSYIDKLYTAMNDYQIIKMRLEGVWGKTFPELEIPLNM